MKKDPIKELNKEYYFNDVSLKSRYKLMKLNKQNEKEGYESGTHWNKNYPYPLMDNDIKYNQYIQHSSTINKINKDNSALFSDINKSGIKSKLNSMDQSSLASKSIMNLKQMAINNDIKLYKQIFPTLYNKKPLNKFIKSSLSINYNNRSESIKKNNNLKKNKKLNVLYRANKINDRISILPSLTEQNIYYNKEVDDILINDDDKNKEKNIVYFSEGNKNKSIHLIQSKKTNEEKLNDNKLDKKIINSFSNRSRNKTNLYFNSLTLNNPSKTYRTINNEKKKIKDWKFLDEVRLKKSYFPKHLYYKNYNYDNSTKGIKNNQNKMHLIQELIGLKFKQIKVYVDSNIDKTAKDLKS